MEKAIFRTIHKFQHNSYANITGMRENGYERMPPVEETLASYLSMGETPSLKVPFLPSMPLQATSRLNGRAYAAAGQAVASLHTMAVLQAYQADLLKDLDSGQGFSPDEVAELRRTTDLALRATKQAASAMGRSMAAMVVTERHLWMNLADLEKKDVDLILDRRFSSGSQRRRSLSLPVLTLIFPALLPCLVRDSLCTALQTKILWINWSLNAIDTMETWVSGNLTALTERSQPAIRWRVGEVANRVSCSSFRGGH